VYFDPIEGEAYVPINDIYKGGRGNNKLAHGAEYSGAGPDSISFYEHMHELRLHNELTQHQCTIQQRYLLGKPLEFKQIMNDDVSIRSGEINHRQFKALIN
jgi:hypothetical protein